VLEQICETIREADARAQALTPWGRGARQHIGAAPRPDARRLELSGLDRVLDYVPSDLTITVEAGITLAAVQALLAPHQQWLPWDPPEADATVGGLLASGACGPLRLGYGGPRDWLLGMRVALGDGRLVKSGGKVVKNVAGYDSHKLHIGALGTLGVICEVTFKLAPLPERSGTLRFAPADDAAALQIVDGLRACPGLPVSLALSAEPGAPPAVLVRYAGVAAAVERQLGAAAALAPAERLGEGEAEALWRALASFPAPGEGLLLRAGAPVGALGGLLAALRGRGPAGSRLLLHGYGLAYARWPAGPQDAAQALAALRADLGRLGGYAVVEDAPPALRSGLDLWGPPPETLALMRALKRQWDPRGVLNPGRYLV
jgi:glycolate oxidase FAD binding subunit